MPGDILVFAEQRQGVLKRVSLQALGLGKELTEESKGELTAVLLGHSVENLAQDLGRHGPAKVYLADDSLLEPYSSEAYTTVLADLINRLNPTVVLMGATAMGKDLAPKLAARLNTSLICDCVGLKLQPEGNLLGTRPIYAGKILAEYQSVISSRQIVTLRPNLFPIPSPDASSAPPLERLPVKVDPKTLTAKIKEILALAEKTIDLTEAKIIVSGGRGMKSPENFKIIEDLAEALGAAVGASRAAVDAGWKPHAYQVGLTGKTVSPLLYIACGISGAIQHQAGMSSSKFIVAINKDPNAPIFKIANYGIVGDLFEVVPLLTNEIKTIKENG